MSRTLIFLGYLWIVGACSRNGASKPDATGGDSGTPDSEDGNGLRTKGERGGPTGGIAADSGGDSNTGGTSMAGGGTGAGGTSGRGGIDGGGNYAGSGGNAPTVPAMVTRYPGPPGIVASDRFEVLVDGQSSFVYQSRSQLGGADNASWTTFSFSGAPVAIEVRRLMGATPQKVVVRPLRRTIMPIIVGNGAKFQISSPAKISVEFDDDLLNKLFIFADAPEVNPPKQGDANVLYFAPGVHDVGAGYTVGSGKTM